MTRGRSLPALIYGQNPFKTEVQRQNKHPETKGMKELKNDFETKRVSHSQLLDWSTTTNLRKLYIFAMLENSNFQLEIVLKDGNFSSALIAQ